MAKTEHGPIFIVGAPRTGTTLAREILTLHPDIHIYDEVHFCERIVDRFGDLDKLPPNKLQAAASSLLKEAKWAGSTIDHNSSITKLIEMAGPHPVTNANFLMAFLKVEAAIHGKTIWGDSSPQDILYINKLKSWYPDAKIITIVRDPRAYLASYKNYVRKGVSSYKNRYNPLINSFLWKRYMNAAIKASQSPWSNDILRVHYEHLVDNPELIVKRMCQFLGLEYHSDMLLVGRQNSSYIVVQDDYKANGINQQSKEKWRESLSTAERWMIEKIASKPMRELGYSAEIKKLPLSQWPSIIGMVALLPGRLFNILFRVKKPFTLPKLRKVLGGKFE